LELDRPPSAETSFVRRWSAAQRDPLVNMKFSWKRFSIASGVALVAIVVLVVFVLGPAFHLFNLAFSPDWAVWFVLPIYLIYSNICIAFLIDFISDAANPWHYIPVFLFSVVIFFIPFALAIGGVSEWIILRTTKLKQRATNGEHKNESREH
jgi:predicted membrane metal-binding protein